jgi:DNA-binding transcriptional LysR family regulator
LLERRLGAALFDRSRNGSQLKLAGQRFIDGTREGEDRLALAIARLRADMTYSGGALRIGVMPLCNVDRLLDGVALIHELLVQADEVRSANTETLCGDLLHVVRTVFRL